MPRIIFIRHSQAQLDFAHSPRDWPLTDEGRARCLDLAHWLKGRALAHVYTSTERKAIQTGQIIAADLDLPLATAEGLQETDYGDVPFYPDHADFVAHVQRGFEHPDDVVFGAESFNAAAARFSAALDTLIAAHPDPSIAIVTHGRVLATFLSRHTDQPAIDLWQSFTMPTALVCRLPDFTPIDHWFFPQG